MTISKALAFKTSRTKKIIDAVLKESAIKSSLYDAAQRMILKKLKALHVDTTGIKFYTKETAPQELKTKIVKYFGIEAPAYVDPNSLSVVIDIGFYDSIQYLLFVIGHELGHLLSIYFGDKLKSGKLLSEVLRLNYNKKYKLKDGRTMIIPDVSGSEENIANMFGSYFSGQALDPKEKKIMDVVQQLATT